MKETQVILNRLLEKFEASKHLSAPNTSKRRVMLRIDKKELPEYNYESAAIRDAYNAAARELEQQSLVQLEWVREQVVLSAVILNIALVMPCYEKAGRLHPREKAEHFAALVSQKLETISVPWIAVWRDDVCEAAQEHLKLPSFCRENDQLLQDLLLVFQKYADITGSITMRTFSSRCFHDTKYFERNVREGFLRIARKYCGELETACQETVLSEREQLALLGIYARPELYELSGPCTIQTQHGQIDIHAAEPFGIALPSTFVDMITGIDGKGVRRITFLENKTNYDEYLLTEKQSDELVIYHGGFLSPQKRKLFVRLAAAFPETVEVRFWADIDRGGFQMFEHLRSIFHQAAPMRMSGKFVEQYHENGLPRTEKYLAKLEEEQKAGLHPLFADAICEIIKYGVTIEQETFLN